MLNKEAMCYGTLNNVPKQEQTIDSQAEQVGRFSTREIVALLAICLTHMGDAVEIYLPSTLTQNISCEMQLSDFQQGILSMVFYSFYAAGRPLLPYTDL